MALVGESGLTGNIRDRHPGLRQQRFRFFDSLSEHVPGRRFEGRRGDARDFSAAQS